MVSVTFAADVETFDIASGDQDVFSLNLREGVSVEGSLSIAGGNGDDVDFWITGPVDTKFLILDGYLREQSSSLLLTRRSVQFTF